MSKLLIRPSRYPDECVVSYLIRVSERNGFRHIGHLLKHAGLTWKNLRVPTHQMITGEYDTARYFTQLGLDYTSPRTAHIYNVAQTASFSTKIDRKSTRLNSSHVKISYAVFCLKKKKNQQLIEIMRR